MRSKNQKIGRPKRPTGEARRGHSKGSGSFNEYRVTGDSFEPIRLFAQSAKQAEDVARRLLGVGEPWEGGMEITRERRL